MKYYLNNPLANNGIGTCIPGVKTIDALTVDFPDFFARLKPDDEVVLIGGDGTLNYLVNHVDTEKIKNKVYILGNGTGNDFLKDINEKPGREVLLNPYLTNLPTVRVNGKEQKYINNMGLGLDGYCCVEADKIKKNRPDSKIGYTGIALKGLFHFFKPFYAWINVDGKEYEYDSVWLAPTMKGKYYGGGMMIAPGQDRRRDSLTVVILRSPSKFSLLAHFSTVFEGKHVNYKDLVKVHTGRKIHVRASRPCPGQIDGETVYDVTEYEAEL